jgi:hypothetical protein
MVYGVRPCSIRFNRSIPRPQAARFPVKGPSDSWRSAASGKLGKGGSDVGSITETFRWNPVGNQSHPVELAGSRKRVLRGSGATPAAKRRQRVPRPCYGASKENKFVGALVVRPAGAASACRMAWHVGPAGV